MLIETIRMGIYQELLPRDDLTLSRFWQLVQVCWLHAHPEKKAASSYVTRNQGDTFCHFLT